MDQYAFRLANLLVGNKDNAAVLEMTGVGAALKFDEAQVVAVCGADMQGSLNDVPFVNWSSFVVPQRADDYLKITRRRSLGLSARYKLVLQAGLAVGLWYVARHSVGLESSLELRISHASLDIPDAVYPLVIFLVIAGSSNAVNLTDGLDGLAAGCCAIVLLAYTAITFITSGEHSLSLLSACFVGGCIGFLWFNAFPASIFMGDTGSLGLGGAIGALAVMTQTEILLIVTGGIFVIEALSVALQVTAFKALRRRVPVNLHRLARRLGHQHCQGGCHLIAVA
jgi:phospho-N-acetylmuramoyl-pentapeptide-transferase